MFGMETWQLLVAMGGLFWMGDDLSHMTRQIAWRKVYAMSPAALVALFIFVTQFDRAQLGWIPGF